MGNSKDNAKGKAGTDQSSKLDAIKDIIFGQQIKEYEAEFDQIRKEIDENAAAGDKLIGKTHADLLKKMDSIHRDLSAKLESSHNTLMQEISKLSEQKTDRKALGKMLENIGNKLSA